MYMYLQEFLVANMADSESVSMYGSNVPSRDKLLVCRGSCLAYSSSASTHQ